MKKQKSKFSFSLLYILLLLITGAIFILCVCVGSVNLTPSQILSAIWASITGRSGNTVAQAVIIAVRLPRVLCVALVGASLSLCGGAMQGLLRNPLADGSTLGVSSGASLGAVLAIAFGIQIPGLPGSGTVICAILFSFLSLICILGMARVLDHSLSTNTIVLVGIIFSMLTSSFISLIISFADDKINSIVFWTMGSLANSTYSQALTLTIALIICSVFLLSKTRELNAFAIGEENARHLGIHVRQTKLVVLATVSILIGICVSIGGTIGFVGLVIPHITRMVTGPNHSRLLPVSLLSGASFLMIADLVARTIASPREIPIGVITSIVGALAFVYIFYLTRKGR